MTCGIYLLRFPNTDKVYVGQSVDIEARYRSHIHNLKKGAATNKLQIAFNLYGLPSLDILIPGELRELDSLEAEAIDIFNSVDCGFNTFSTAIGHGSAMRGDNHGMSLYSNDDIIEVFLSLTKNRKISMYDLSKRTGVSLSAIRKVSSGENHSWLRDIYPIEYDLLLSLKGGRKRILNKYPIIVDPKGTEHQVLHLNEFAKLNSLNSGSLSRVLNGKLGSVNGWKIKLST